MLTKTNYFGNAFVLDRNITVYSNEVLYFEGKINYTYIHLTSGKPKMLARTLLLVEGKVGKESFARISRKHLVNRKFITEIGLDYVVLCNKLTLSISRRRKQEFLNGLKIMLSNNKIFD